eukprot:CAMPEP_0179430370 /NCGR_PEP_ID=MMETSP0799-20121207/15534_1 /TAXON_ID=46947 /ORGANISM="Geminigera cryophila, Strain CCMP2564" /LENGTH=71 /DNA_ID=CAMNT_0021206781 /DNA_START=360 /DNA_END=575 /DNA_ORIENTATION=-
MTNKNPINIYILNMLKMGITNTRISHIRTSHVTRTNTRVMSHVRIHESCHRYEYDMSHTPISRVLHVKKRD